MPVSSSRPVSTTAARRARRGPLAPEPEPDRATDPAVPVRRVLVVDDDPMVRHAYRLLLSRLDGFEVCGDARDGADDDRRRRRLAGLQPDSDERAFFAAQSNHYGQRRQFETGLRVRPRRRREFSERNHRRQQHALRDDRHEHFRR